MSGFAEFGLNVVCVDAQPERIERNVYEPARIASLAFRYVSVGRRPRGPGAAA